MGLRADDPVSPELALVDSTLRERLRQEETLPVSPAPAPEPAVHSVRPRRRRFGWALAAVLIAAAALGAGAAWYSLHRPTASSTTDASDATARSSTNAGVGSAGIPAGRTFAWAPVRGVPAYDVEIRRNGTVVYSTRTTASRIQLPAPGKLGERTLTLSPGAYQWYVWPVVLAGGTDRHGPAIVATTFEITR